VKLLLTLGFPITTALTVVLYGQLVVKHHLPLAAMQGLNVVQALVLILLLKPAGVSIFPNLTSWPLVGVYLLLSVGTTSLWFLLTRRYGVSSTSAMECTYPLFVLAINLLLSFERFSWAKSCGVILIVGGILLLEWL